MRDGPRRRELGVAARRVGSIAIFAVLPVVVVLAVVGFSLSGHDFA